LHQQGGANPAEPETTGDRQRLLFMGRPDEPHRRLMLNANQHLAEPAVRH
jgi:hypothetical protein